MITNFSETQECAFKHCKHTMFKNSAPYFEIYSYFIPSKGKDSLNH